MRLKDFDYELPAELIAQQPLAERTSSRMMLLDRPSGAITDSDFSKLPDLLRYGDTLVLNNTKVFPARLFGISETGARVEIFLVRDLGGGLWDTLARPAKRLRAGKKILFGQKIEAFVTERLDEGHVAIRFTEIGDVDDLLEKIGRTPLPPYIKRSSESPDSDRDRYQTVYAKHRGAIAAPTAGLHFTPELLSQVRGAGVTLCEITLHVGYGTFEPVRVCDLSQHKVSPEEYEISKETAETLNQAVADGNRIVAVGTTTTRALESAIQKHGRFVAFSGYADLTIRPGYKFRAVDALLTNFHLPKSSLLVLASTFAGHELIMKAYRHAVETHYRFYSYGDCMLMQ